MLYAKFNRWKSPWPLAAALVAAALTTCAQAQAQQDFSDAERKADSQTQVEQTLKQYSDAVAAAEKLKPQDSRLAAALEDFGFFIARHGKLADAESAFSRAISLRERLGERSTSEIRNDRMMLGGIYRDEQKDEEAQQVFLDTLAEARESGNDDFYLARCLSVLGHFYGGRGDFDEAEPYFLEALKVLETAKPYEDQNLFEVLSDIALLYSNAQKPEKAVPYVLRHLELERKLRGADSLDVARRLTTLSDTYFHAGELAEAEVTTQQALAIYLKHGGAETSSAAAMQTRLADIAAAQQNYSKAEQIYTDVLKNPVKSPSENGFQSSLAIRALAKLYVQQKKYSEAETLLQQLMQSQMSEPAGSGLLLGTAEQLGPVYVAQGNVAEAETLYKSLIDEDRKALQPGNLATIASLNDLAEFYAETDRYEESEKYFKETIAEFGDTSAFNDGLTLGNLSIVMGNYARLLTKMGRSDDAATYDAKAQELLKRASPKPLHPREAPFQLD